MNTEIFLLNYSFQYPSSGIGIEDLEDRIQSLADDYTFIKAHGDKLLKHDSIYAEEIYPKVTVSDYLYSSQTRNFSRDVKKSLLKIIDHSHSTAMTIEEILQLLDKHHEAIIYGLLCLHRVSSVEEKYLIYNRHNWFAFHRHFLGMYPISESHFYEESQKYFPQLFFHERVKDTLKTLETGLPGFSMTIVGHLGLLNDEFHKYYDRANRVESLKQFSSACGIEATPQGDAKDKPKMTFEFVNDSKQRESVCCEPHLKLCHSDEKGDRHYYFNRIYFHEGKGNIEQGRILIGHIGKHLQF